MRELTNGDFEMFDFADVLNYDPSDLFGDKSKKKQYPDQDSGSSGFDLSSFGMSNENLDIYPDVSGGKSNDWGFRIPQWNVLGSSQIQEPRQPKQRTHSPRALQKINGVVKGKLRPFDKDNVSEVPNEPGNYMFYDENKKPIYVGRSHILRHRLQSYYEKDDFDEHPTKEKLRKEIKYFKWQRKPIGMARDHENGIKDKLKHNHL